MTRRVHSTATHRTGPGSVRAYLLDRDGVILAHGDGPDRAEATAAAWVVARARGVVGEPDTSDPTDRPDLHRDAAWSRESEAL